MGVDDLDCITLLHANRLALATRNQNEVSLGLGLDSSGCSR